MLTLTLRPRFSETDALGHINNTVVPVWFLQAREPILAMFAPDGDLSHGSIAVVRIEVDYLAETRFGQEVEIRTRVDAIGNSSFRLQQEVWQQGTLTARGLATLVNFDVQDRRAKPIPEPVRQALSAHLEDSGNNGKEG